MAEESTDADVVVIQKEKIRTKHPKQYKVILLNDDYTTMDFVVAILESIFKKTPAEAVQIMLQVHKDGRGVCGIYSKQIAEAKVMLVMERSRSSGYPLRCIMEQN
jgi:ATP-dependent Clp protease adaptor protein ClpS